MNWQIPEAAHAQTIEQVLSALHTSATGLSAAEAHQRLQTAGRNVLPEASPEGLLLVFMHQFRNPLIYILLVAATLSIVIGEYVDAGFIFFVLILNAIIGATQEYNAQQSAMALRSVLTQHARVKRDGDIQTVEIAELVPGDIVLLESGDRVPADMRLAVSLNVLVDESLLTGESVPCNKDAKLLVSAESHIADQLNMLFAGTMVLKGRVEAVVVATGKASRVGEIAQVVTSGRREQPPLIQRMERMTQRIGIVFIVLTVLLMLIAVIQKQDIIAMLLIAVALAVAAIPEGLPVAVTVALSVGMRRMARQNVIVRRLVAAETLGSCTCIASDKTGTLTVNEMTVKRLWLPDDIVLEVTGEGLSGSGRVHMLPDARPIVAEQVMLLTRTAALCNEASLYRESGELQASGDPVDVALLVLATKSGFVPEELSQRYSLLASVPFEPEHRYAATLNTINDQNLISVKGAIEQVMAMCSHMQTGDGMSAINSEQIEAAANNMAADGYRVLALAVGHTDSDELAAEQLQNMQFVGLVGMIDPPRPEALKAIQQCRQAGIKVVMVTGDHPVTAVAIAKQLGINKYGVKVLTGLELHKLQQQGEQVFDLAVNEADVFARVEPTDKLEIVRALTRAGHFVAVTGDGANDAPALRSAHVGVAMGKKGTDVARESAELVLADDNFASLVEGIRQGRIAYSNIRKVIFLLISTGVAEVILFLLSLAAGLPVPFTAVQLLWLNLVTQGIQDVGLAFEKYEGSEMDMPPRRPAEPIFNRIMIERTLISAAVMAVTGFLLYRYLLLQGMELEQARNYTLLLLVLFENVHVFNSRSEHRSVFVHNPLANPILLFGTMLAQLVHIIAMYTPGLNQVLDIQPVSMEVWLMLFSIALFLLFVMEIYKLLTRKRFAMSS